MKRFSPAARVQAWTRINPTVYACVRALCADPSTTVVIFSGSDKQKLEDIFGGLDLWLAAENGMFMRGPPTPDGPAAVCPGPIWSLFVTQTLNPKPPFFKGLAVCQALRLVRLHQRAARTAGTLHTRWATECKNGLFMQGTPRPNGHAAGGLHSSARSCLVAEASCLGQKAASDPHVLVSADGHRWLLLCRTLGCVQSRHA